MARKKKGYDDLEEMRKDIDKLGEALRISPKRKTVPARKDPNANPAPDPNLHRALARMRAGKAGKDEDRV